MREEMKLLKNKAKLLISQVCKSIVIKLLDSGSIKAIRATGWSIQAAKNIHRSAFARSTCTHDSQVVALEHLQIEPIESFDLSFTRSINFTDITELSHRWAVLIGSISQGKRLMN
jgi:hypothetical protein